jgi:predicted NAD/FAD-binding protein
MPDKKRSRIAVIGGGISGIMSAWLLQREHDVTVFEANDCLGGHAHSVKIDNGLEPPFFVDTAFLIFNKNAYPLFIRFIKELGVFSGIKFAEMSFSISDFAKDLHYALNTGLGACFYQKKNLASPDFYRIFTNLLRFRKKACQDLLAGKLADISLKDYLKEYPPYFKENFIYPVAMAVWSLPQDKIMGFPAESFIRFYFNHNLLKGFGFLSHHWYSFINGSIDYVRAFSAKFSGEVKLNCPVLRVDRTGTSVIIHTPEGEKKYDKVIFATHADTTLKMLQTPSQQETELLGKWQYQDTPVTLHTDQSLLYPDKKLWASWNIITRDNRSLVTYYLNRVQNLKSKKDYFLTLGETGIDPGKVISRFNYAHPVYDFRATSTQAALDQLNGHLNSYFCGSYFGYGFHEDGAAAAVKVARRFGIEF